MAMYSTDISDGNFYHSFNHALRFGVFFGLMLFLSFINIKHYFTFGFIFYGLVLILLIAATFFGTTVQGSQRWINLYFINLQPSELMKIARSRGRPTARKSHSDLWSPEKMSFN